MLFQRDIDGADGWHNLEQNFRNSLAQLPAPRRALIIPPDSTRLSSGAGRLTQVAYQMWGSGVAAILPAVGSHRPMQRHQLTTMFGAIPERLFLSHHWQRELQDVGTLSAHEVASFSDGRITQPCQVMLNRHLVGGDWDCILSIGQVAPHEVAGFSNYSKNLLIGLGGQQFIDLSHYLSALCGIDKIMGVIDNPVRRLLDYAHQRWLSKLPLLFALTVAQSDSYGTPKPAALYVGDDRRVFEAAASHSATLNITTLQKPLTRAVVYLNPQEYRSLWLANKAIYRLRMALAYDAQLIIIAPGVDCYAEDARRNALIARHGYCGLAAVQRAVEEEETLAAQLATAAHLIHGSTEGRFQVIYCTEQLSEAEMQQVGYRWATPQKIERRYLVNDPSLGFNQDSRDEQFYFVTHPGAALWQSAPQG